MIKLYSILLILIFSCDGKLLESHTSPSAQYTLDVELGNRDLNEKDRYRLMFKLVDKSKKELDYIRTRSSDVMKWVVVWYNDSIIILDSHDVGTYGWTISKNNKLIPMDSVQQVMEDKAIEAFRHKYGMHGIQH